MLPLLRTACFASTAFRTVVNVPPNPFMLGPDSRALFLGSCFAENIGARLGAGSIDALVNPSHGILYNPISLANTLERIASAAPYTGADLHACSRDPSRLISWHHHSRFGGRAGREAELARVNGALASAHDHLRGPCEVLFLTLGTAWAFTRGGSVVANCHKQPAHTFERTLVTADRAAAALERAVRAARAVAPGLHVVLTVSPVRHWKDGAVDNSLSKGTLVVAAHQLAHALGGADGRASYFPSFEIMMDDLRDYRFYAADMLHPSELALEHIWGAFSRAYLTAPALERVAAVEAVRRAASHRPMDSGSGELGQFARAQLRKVDEIERRWGARAGRALADECAHFARLSESSG